MREVCYLVSEAAHTLSNLCAIGLPSRLERGANDAGPVYGLFCLSVPMFGTDLLFSVPVSFRRNGQFTASGRFGSFDEP